MRAAAAELLPSLPALPSLQSRGADPSVRTEDYDPYLSPGRKLPVEVSAPLLQCPSRSAVACIEPGRSCRW